MTGKTLKKGWGLGASPKRGEGCPPAPPPYFPTVIPAQAGIQSNNGGAP
jgi:hypothetical protein